MKRFILVVAALAVVALMTQDAEARRARRGGGCSGGQCWTAPATIMMEEQAAVPAAPNATVEGTAPETTVPEATAGTDTESITVAEDTTRVARRGILRRRR